MVDRPLWYLEKNNKFKIDLSKNVHYDKILMLSIENELKQISNFNNYPDEYSLYNSISNYYNLSIKEIAIGFGSTDVIERTLRAIEFKKIYIVSPTFEMLEIYCKILNLPYKKITDIELLKITDKESAVYVANPNGLTGKLLDLSFLHQNFKYCIIDEAYADFNNVYSLLHLNLQNVIIIKTLSKSLGVAGFRVGFAKGSVELIEKIQSLRMNFISNSISCLIVPKIINLTSEVIGRMLITKNYLQENFPTIETNGNFVLFKEPNKYTEKFGYRLVESFYRMALTDMETLNE